jgi:hypothetical protein
MRVQKTMTANQEGKVYVKVFWLTSILLSLFLTLILNLLLHH